MKFNFPRLIAVIIPFLIVITFSSTQKNDEKNGSGIVNRGEGQDDWWLNLPRPEWKDFERISQEQPWFEVYKILPGIIAIYEPGQFEEVISYLILGRDKTILFDTGLGIGNMKRLVSELTDIEPIVINSHTHYDHIGGNHYFQTIYGVETDFSARNRQGVIHNTVKEFVSEGWIWKDTPQEFNKEEYRIATYGIADFLSGGQVLNLGGRKLEVILTPGHTPDALCLLDRENRILFTGDTFYPAPLYAHFPESDLQDFEESAYRLSELQSEVDHLLPSHNIPLVESRYLSLMRDAFISIRNGETNVKQLDGNLEYMFEGFSILVRPDAIDQ